MERIFIRFGVEVFQDHDDYYTRFDAGGLAANVKEIKITKEEAGELMQQQTVAAMGAYIMRFYERVKTGREVPVEEW